MNRFPAKGGCLVAVAAVSITSFGRTFNGWDWLVPTGIAAALGAATASLFARRLWRVTAVAASSLVGAWFVVLAVDPSRTLLGLPTIGGLRSVVDLGLAAWDLSKEAIAPIDPMPGLLVLLLSAAWVAAATSKVVFSTGWHIAALIPWLGIFGYASAVGVPEGRGTAVALMASALVAYLLVISRDVMTADIAAPASRLGVVAVAGGMVFAGLLPGYDSPPVFEMGPTISSAGTRLAPFEFISRQLMDDEERVMFTVRADKPAYWRLAALDHYDGRTWSKGRELTQRVPLPRSRGIEPDTVTVRQRFTIHDLRGDWVPTAFRPHLINGIQVLSDPIRNTIYTNGLEARTTYYAVSMVPNPSRGKLDSAKVTGRSQVADAWLPARIEPRLGQIARELTSAAPTPYSKALAIQDHLRSFKYSLEIPRIGHSDEDLVEFLTEDRKGYCENFAGAMAVLMRSLGIPARVAVGFLPGDQNAGTFTVKNTDAHAWTEVWFDELGWISFEPTPRGEATPPSYATPAGLASPGPPDPETVHPGLSGPAATASPSPSAGAIPDVGGEPSTVRATAMRTGVAVLSLLLVALIIKAAWIRFPYRRAGNDPALRATAAFRELELRGYDCLRAPRPDETEREFASAFADRFDLDDGKIASVVDPWLRLTYSSATPTEREADEAIRLMKTLRRDLAKKAGPVGRAKMAVAPGTMMTRAGRALVDAMTRR